MKMILFWFRSWFEVYYIYLSNLNKPSPSDVNVVYGCPIFVLKFSNNSFPNAYPIFWARAKP